MLVSIFLRLTSKARLLQPLKKLPHRRFIRNLLVVAGGTAASQGINLAFAPLITRLYGPEVYGIQGIFMSVAGIVAAIAALTYPTAIMLPRNDENAKRLAWLSVIIGTATAAAVAVVFYVGGAGLLAPLHLAAIHALAYFIPIFMLASVISDVTTQWLLRREAFALSARANALQSLAINVVKVGAGLFYPSAASLIVTGSLGRVVGPIIMLTGLRGHKAGGAPRETASEPARSLTALARDHIDFPILRTPQVFINAISFSLPTLALAAFFGPSPAAYYAIASSAMIAPSRILGAAVLQVFYPRINRALHNNENARSLIVLATAGLALTGAGPFALVILWGPELFGAIFGQDWVMAGGYAQWLSLILFFQFINKPVMAAIPALRLQGGLLLFEVFSTTARVSALVTGYLAFDSDLMAIALYSVAGAIAYVWLILWVIARAKQ